MVLVKQKEEAVSKPDIASFFIYTIFDGFAFLLGDMDRSIGMDVDFFDL